MAVTNAVIFKSGTYAQWSALATKDANTLYFLSDTLQIMKGDKPYGGSVAFGTADPSESIGGTLYINTTAYTLWHHNGTAWVKVAQMLNADSAFEIKPDNNQGNVVTGVTFANGKFTFTKGITAATTGELSDVDDKIDQHIADKNNPHGVTAAQVGAYTIDQIDQKFHDLHSHNNKVELDKITDGDVAKWNAEIGAKQEAQSKVAGTAANEKVLSVGDDHLIKSTLSLDYDSTNKKIQLKGISDAVVAELDATAFIKDGMVQGVSFDPDTKKLTITFNVDSGNGTTAKESIEVDLTSLVDTYTQGNGITITGNVISVKVDNASESFLTVGEGGVKLSGVQDAINSAAEAATLVWCTI